MSVELDFEFTGKETPEELDAMLDSLEDLELADEPGTSDASTGSEPELKSEEPDSTPDVDTGAASALRVKKRALRVRMTPSLKALPLKTTSTSFRLKSLSVSVTKNASSMRNWKSSNLNVANGSRASGCWSCVTSSLKSLASIQKTCRKTSTSPTNNLIH